MCGRSLIGCLMLLLPPQEELALDVPDISLHVGCGAALCTVGVEGVVQVFFGDRVDGSLSY